MGKLGAHNRHKDPHWTVRRFPGKFAQVAELAKVVYSYDTHAYKSYLRWKWRTNYGKALAVITESNGRAIGSVALLPLYIKIRKKAFRCAFATELMVHPKFRRHGIFIEMLQRIVTEAAKERINLIYTIGNAASRQGVIKHIGFLPVGDVLVLKKYLKPLSAIPCLWVYQSPTPTNLLKFLGALAELVVLVLQDKAHSLSNAILSIYTSNDDGKPNVQIREMHPLTFNAEFDRLWNEADNSLVTVVRNRDFLNWRFKNPNSEYHIFRADRGLKLRGYCAISYTTMKKFKIAWIVALLGAGSEVEMALIRHAMKRAKEDGAHVVLTQSTTTPSYARKLGMNISRWDWITATWWRRSVLILRIVNPRVSNQTIGEASNWYFTPADNDVV